MWQPHTKRGPEGVCVRGGEGDGFMRAPISRSRRTTNGLGRLEPQASRAHSRHALASPDLPPPPALVAARSCESYFECGSLLVTLSMLIVTPWLVWEASSLQVFEFSLALCLPLRLRSRLHYSYSCSCSYSYYFSYYFSCSCSCSCSHCCHNYH